MSIGGDKENIAHFLIENTQYLPNPDLMAMSIVDQAKFQAQSIASVPR